MLFLLYIVRSLSSPTNIGLLSIKPHKYLCPFIFFFHLLLIYWCLIKYCCTSNPNRNWIYHSDMTDSWTRFINTISQSATANICINCMTFNYLFWRYFCWWARAKHRSIRGPWSAWPQGKISRKSSNLRRNVCFAEEHFTGSK